MKNQFLKERTKIYSIEIVRFCLRQQTGGVIPSEILKQLLRSSTSVGANYRAACRGKSIADFVNKLKIVVEEADESLFWLELVEELYPSLAEDIESLKIESNEIIAICVSSISTSRKNYNV
ncbi:MAG: four helix bundle protein [Saprospiraceae bacterium]|nr:four helix bundle protein [Saprospiraceae bacterium]